MMGIHETSWQFFEPLFSVKITITYTTADDASALQWLPPAQTAGKTHPYLFSQCQAIINDAKRISCKV